MNRQTVLQGVIITDELLLIFHIRINENLHGTRRQNDSTTSEGTQINLSLQRVRSYVNHKKGGKNAIYFFQYCTEYNTEKNGFRCSEIPLPMPLEISFQIRAIVYIYDISVETYPNWI